MKKCLLSLLSILICTMFMPTIASAESLDAEINMETSDEKIESVDELKEAIESAYDDDGKVTDEEAKAIGESSSSQVLIDFFEEKMDDADAAIEAADIDIDEVIDNGSDGYGKVELDIGDHSEVVVEFEDKEDLTPTGYIKNMFILPVYAAKNGESKWKKYGNRSFTAKKTVLSGIGGAVIKLENHYKVSAKGLDERYGDAYVSAHFSVGITGDISASEPIISDASARTPGKSNINMYARYPYRYEIDGKATAGGTYKMSTAVDYLKKDSANKRIKVKHRWWL